MNAGHRRIHIIGGPGSGKTTLARRLAAELGVPCWDLDEIAFEGGAGAERPLETRMAEAERIASFPGWVTEGIYLGWTEPLFQAADTIIWLDLPWRIAGWRIFMRHIKAEIRGNNRHSGWMKLYRFMRWCASYYDLSQSPEDAVNRNAAERFLAAYSGKIIPCRRPGEVSTAIVRIINRSIN